jgi:hypothetical protein
MSLYRGKTSLGKVFKGASLKGAFKMPKTPKAKVGTVRLKATKTVAPKAVKVKI